MSIAERFRGFLPVVIDLETGGFNSQTDAILEMACITVRMDEQGWLKPDKKYFTAVEPFEGANIEPASLAFTGIKLNSPLRMAKDEQTAFTEMFQLIRKAVKDQGCKRAIIVAHNAHFDHAFIKSAVERHDIKRDPLHPFSNLDTVSFSALAYGQTVLAQACRVAGIEFDNKEAHSALYDTEKTCELFCTIINRNKILGGWPLNDDYDDS